jgi:hypothetical protein
MTGFDAARVEDEAVVEAGFGRGMTLCLRLYVGSGTVSGVSTGGGEAVGINICAKCGLGRRKLGRQRGCKSRCAGC